MIKDTVHVRLEAGKGGDGSAKFSPGVKKFPVGGMGGNGGDVYVVGTTDIQDLRPIDEGKIFKAEDGEVGGPSKQTGADGKDITIKLPLITEIYDQLGNLKAVIDKLDQPILLLKGGEGGLGNYYFRKGFEGRFDHFTKGKKGQRYNATLKFMLSADIIFIGFPNAGKSSMLNALTNANVKVGNYPFTTLSPHLGRLNRLTLMDLPGLIEGTFEGKGLGTAFVQHTRYAKVIAHFISLESDDLLRDYQIMRKELENIDKELINKKEIILLTKSDMFSLEEVQEKMKSLKSIESEKMVVSAIDDEALKKVSEKFLELGR